MSKHTPGPYSGSSTGFQTNDGAVPIMAGEKRIALVDCQTKAKRGEGWKTKCAERDANARLFIAAPDLCACLSRANKLIDFMSRYVGRMAPYDYGNFYADLNEHFLESPAALALAGNPAADEGAGS